MKFLLAFIVFQSKYSACPFYQGLKDFMGFIQKDTSYTKTHSEFQITDIKQHSWNEYNPMDQRCPAFDSETWLLSMKQKTIHDLLTVFGFFPPAKGLEPKGDLEVVKGKR